MVSVRIRLTNTDAVARVSIQDAQAIMAFKWRAHPSRHTQYAVRYANGHRSVSMHESILSKGCDHIDRNGLNNTRSNLRPATRSQQRMNAKLQRNNRSGHRGVHWYSKERKWRARINVGGKRIELGRFKELSDAVAARRAAVAMYFGEYSAEHERN